MQAPQLTCAFRVNIGLEGCQNMLSTIYEGIEGLKLDESNGLDPENPQQRLVHLRGIIDPEIFIKKLYMAKIYVMLDRIDYGYEENPEGARKPNRSQFMRCVFKLNTLSWYELIMGALRTIQGLSFTIVAEPETGYQMAYLYGNIEYEVLRNTIIIVKEKTLKKKGIVLLRLQYGLSSKWNQDPDKTWYPQRTIVTQNTLKKQIGKR